MATVQAYTKAGVDAKFNSRSNMTIVHSGGGTPDIAAFPDAKTGDVIERSGDGARWSVIARNLTPVAGRVVSVGGKTGVVTLGPGDVGAAPKSHTHTKAQISDLNASIAANSNTIAQRGSGGVLFVGTPTDTTHAATKAYVDSQITGGISWGNLSGKPSTFAPSTHNHTMSQITDLPEVTTSVKSHAIVRRSTTSQVPVPTTPVGSQDAASKAYVDSSVTSGIKWSNLSGKPSTFTPSTHSHTQAQVTGLPEKLTELDAAAAKVDDRIAFISGSTSDRGRLVSLTSAGRLGSVAPINDADVANKQYVDSQISAKTTWGNTSGKPSTFPPSAHTHTVSDITGLTLSQTATGSSVVQRDSSGRATVATPTATGHATTKAYVDNAVTAGKAWSAITGKPSTFTPSAHTHTRSQITDLPEVTTTVSNRTIVLRTTTGAILVSSTPSGSQDATSKKYVDDKFVPTFLGNDNLNDVTTPGAYIQGLTANATTDNNYPPDAAAGFLEVIGTNVYVKQEYTDYRARYKYYRTKYSSTWYAWRAIQQTEV